VLSVAAMILDRIPEIKKLTKTEQVELCGELIDLLAEDDAWNELTPEIITELDRSMEEYRRDPSTGRTWDQVKARIAASEWRQWQK
jgi:putative addiction module component (TIGR02574 family)